MAKKNAGFLKFFSKKKRNYEAASRKPRVKRWRAPGTSVNSDTFKDLSTLRNRSRELVRNNPIANKGISVIASNVVGHGIKTKFSGRNAELVQKRWNKWAKSRECDFDNRLNYYAMQKTIMRAVVESGETLIRKRTNSKKDIPLQYQVLESDFLANEASTPDRSIVQGIELDSQGRVSGYHVHETHPGDMHTVKVAINKLSVDQLMHVYRVDRPGQLRGVPWLHPAMIRIKDLDEFLDATIIKQKVSASFAGFVKDMSVELVDPEEGESDNDMAEYIEGGVIEMLPPGKDITFPNPPSMEEFKDFTSVFARNIASGLGISYESLSGDLSQVNFSSARMGWLEMHRNINSWRRDVLISMFIDPSVEDFLKTLETRFNIDLSDVEWEHISPKREMIDPTKEVLADIRAVRAGFTTLSEVISSYGKDPDRVLNEVAEVNEMLDNLGIVVDTDPRKITTAGIKQADEVESNTNE